MDPLCIDLSLDKHSLPLPTPPSLLRSPVKALVIVCSTSTVPTPPYTPLNHHQLLVQRLKLLDTSLCLPATNLAEEKGVRLRSLRRDLSVEDQAQMQELMMLKCTKEHYAMAAEIISIIIPARTAASDTSVMASEEQAKLLSSSLRSWCGLSKHPLCTLISTVILLERLHALYPKFNDKAIKPDTPLRLTFSSFLLALQFTCDGSFQNSSFVGVRSIPWSLQDINVMERELLAALSFDVYISPDEFLHRATGFWTRHLHLDSARPSTPPSLASVSSYSPSSSTSSTSPSTPPIGNLFLLRRRSGIEERGWKSGIVRSPAKRMGDVVDGERETVWREGRLERTEKWVSSRSKSLKKKREKASNLEEIGSQLRRDTV